MPPQTFEEKKQQQARTFLNQEVTEEKQEQIKQRLESGAYNYEFEFTSNQARKQQDFYGDYERRWGEKSEGFLVDTPQVVDPVEREVEDRKLGYLEKIRRKKSARTSYGVWREKMAALNIYQDERIKETKHKTGFHRLEVREPLFGLRFDRTRDVGSDSFDLMKSTLRFAAINQKREAIFAQLLKEGKKEGSLAETYKDTLIALAPPIVANKTENLDDPITFTEESVTAYTAYMKKAIEDPVGSLKNAISDSLFSFSKISTKLLEKNNMPESFDQAKLLRDKFKAITTLFETRGTGDDVLKMIAEIKKDEKLAPKQNVTFAKGLYQCIDKDMRFAMEKSGIVFDNNTRLVDRETTANAIIQKKGGQAAALLKLAKKEVAKEDHNDVERYWDRRAHELISKEDDKDPKSKKRDFTDTYNIAGAVNTVAEERKGSVAGANNKKFFKMLTENGNQLALAVYDIDKELQDAKDVFERRKDELAGRPEMKKQLREYINRRRQQQLDLMDRAAGVINAMKYLAGAVALDANGSAALKDIQYTYAQQQKENEKKKKKKAEADIPVPENVEIQSEDLVFGVKKDVTELAFLPLSFKELKKKLLDKFKDHPDVEELRTALLVSEPLHVNMLKLSNRNLLSMSMEDVVDALYIEYNDAQITKKIGDASKELDEMVDFLYEKVENQGINSHTLRERTYLVEQFAKAREKLYALNQLKGVKSALTNKTYESMIKEGKTPGQLESMKYKTLITNLKFKVISDNMEHYRCQHLKRLVEADAASDDMFTAHEADLKKKKARDLVGHYHKKMVAAAMVRDKHKEEFDKLQHEAKAGLIALTRRIIKEPEEYKHINELHEEEHEEEEIHQEQHDEEIHDEEIHNEEIHDEHHDDQHHDEEVPRVKKENIDEEVLKLHIEGQFQGTYDRVHEEFENAPQFGGGDDALAATKQQIQKYILTKDFNSFSELLPQIQQSLQSANKGDQVLSEVMQNTFLLMSTDVFKGTLVKNVTEKIAEGTFKDLNEDQKNVIDVTVSEANPDYIWFMNQMERVQTIDDLKKLRTLWSSRREYVKQYYTTEMNVAVYYKIDAIMYALGRALDLLQTKQIVESIKDNILGYKTDKKPDEPDFDLKTDDPENIYNFDQHQQGDLACWTASHTYVVNAYMKAHKIEAPKFTQGTLKNPENFIPHESVKHYIDSHDDNDPDSMSFNQEADNIKTFLTQDRMGNPYTMADTVITKIPKTAEHHLVFTNFFIKNNAQSTPEVKEKLSEYLLDKVEKELKRTKTPISILSGMHYLSIVGVDRQKKCFLTMNSQHEGAALNDYTELTVETLLNANKFEMIYPEYLDDENLTYIKKRFGMKEDLYDAEGNLNVDEQLQRQKDAFKEQPQNMLHVNGYEFDMDKDHYDHPFEDYFVNEQIYMPSNLDLPRKLQKK